MILLIDWEHSQRQLEVSKKDLSRTGEERNLQIAKTYTATYPLYTVKPEAERQQNEGENTVEIRVPIHLLLVRGTAERLLLGSPYFSLKNPAPGTMQPCNTNTTTNTPLCRCCMYL